MNHATDMQLGADSTERSVPIIIASAKPTDHGYIWQTWIDSFHRAKSEQSRSFSSGYKERQGGLISRMLQDGVTRILCAYHPTARVQGNPAILGWLAWTPADKAQHRSIPAVHYAYTRFRLEGETWHRRGILTALLEHAELGPRLVYTHKGEYRKGGYWSRSHWPRPLDEELVEWLGARGVTAVYEPAKEWIS